MNLKRSASIVDVANRAGVSPATVSRCFNHPDLVREDTRFRINEAVEATGYIRNRAASAIHGKTSGTIGLLVPTIDNSIFSRLIQSFSETLDRQGYSMLISTNGYDLELEYTQLRNMLEHRVDAIALVGLEHSERSYKLLGSRHTPAIALWNFDPASPVSCVGADNREAGRAAARHILDLGHRDIALLFPPPAHNDRAQGRLDGVRETLGGAGVDVPNRHLLTAKYDTAHACKVALDLFAGPDRPTAVIAGNDVIARGVIVAAHKAGLRVPDELSVIGIGDFPGSAEFVPPLTTVNLSATEVGQVAAELLASNLISPDAEDVRRVRSPVRLVVRESTGRP